MTTWWIRRPRSTPCVLVNIQTNVDLATQPNFKSREEDIQDGNAQTAFIHALQHLVHWNKPSKQENERFFNCIHATFIDINYDLLDFSIGIAQLCKDYDVESCHRTYDPLKSIRYVVRYFFHQRDLEERRHILAYAYVLMSRIVKHQGMRIPLLAINSIVCMSLLVSSKLLEDECLSNSYWAVRVVNYTLDEEYLALHSNISSAYLTREERQERFKQLHEKFAMRSTRRFNRIEKEFLDLCQFDLYVTETVLADAEMFLHNELPLKHAPMVIECA